MAPPLIIGWTISTLWIVGVATLLIFKWEDAANMKMNEWGDFIAGTTAPLALIWLTLGYYLQKRELAENTKALNAQVAESRKIEQHTMQQAEATQELANATKAQVQSLIEQENQLALPRFYSRGGMISGNSTTTEVVNDGATVTSVSVSTDSICSLDVSPKARWASGEVGHLILVGHPGKVIEYPVRFQLKYVDSKYRERTSNFVFLGNNHIREERFTDVT